MDSGWDSTILNLTWPPLTVDEIVNLTVYAFVWYLIFHYNFWSTKKEDKAALDMFNKIGNFILDVVTKVLYIPYYTLFYLREWYRFFILGLLYELKPYWKPLIDLFRSWVSLQLLLISNRLPYNVKLLYRLIKTWWKNK